MTLLLTTFFSPLSHLSKVFEEERQERIGKDGGQGGEQGPSGGKELGARDDECRGAQREGVRVPGQHQGDPICQGEGVGRQTGLVLVSLLENFARALVS